MDMNVFRSASFGTEFADLQRDQQQPVLHRQWPDGGDEHREREGQRVHDRFGGPDHTTLGSQLSRLPHRPRLEPR